MNYLDVANSGFMFILCLIPVGVIVLQAVRFMMMAWKQGIEIGMDKNKLKKCITTSATISVIPALSLVSLMIAMSPNMGKFFPWLRLSNIGAGGYEPMAAVSVWKLPVSLNIPLAPWTALWSLCW